MQTKEINVLEIREEPIFNEDGLIENLEFSVIIDPNTPIPDGTYASNGCSLNSFEPFEYKPYPNIYLANCYDQDLISTNNEIKLKVNNLEGEWKSNNLDRITTYQVDGPYIFYLFKNLFQYSGSHTQNYILKYEEDFFEEFCKDPNGDDIRLTQCGYGSSTRSRVGIVHKTNSYNYTQFV